MAKFTITFGPDSDEVLDRLASQAGTSKADIIKRALALYNYAETETKRNPKRKLAITEDNVAVRDIVLH